MVFTPPAPVPPSAFETWGRLIGGQPQGFQQNPAGMPPGSNASGLLGVYQANIGVQLGRIDITLQPQVDGAPPSHPPTIVDKDAAIQTLVGLGQKLAIGDNPIRVAFIINCAINASSEAEAVAIFKGATNLSHIPSTASDLNFALNVRRGLGAAGWQMNRFVRWGLGQVQFVQFQVVSSGSQFPQTLNAHHLATMAIDINSVPRNIPLGPTQAADAIASLAAEAKLIMSQGYDRLSSAN
ncbi:hypothetical protein [uncultured Sphingomonas sp.]|uniref:hypothetical protein n=1 Tax=uncultured Sphingomonas sp. TaxID=158754 RepID=UPI00260D09EA|nr:hypothetical protein [uncultured Sphingomonas sp.]